MSNRIDSIAVSRANLLRWREDDVGISADEKVERARASAVIEKAWETTGGGVSLQDYAELTALPADMFIEGNLSISYCHKLVYFGNGMRVLGDVYLYGSNNVTSIGDMIIDGNFNLAECYGITSVLANIHVDGDMTFGECPDVASLSPDLYVGGKLDLWGCAGLTCIPNEIYVGVNLSVSGCSGLTTLPPGVDYEDGLDIGGCSGITSLPDGMRVYGDVDLSHTSLETLPDDLYVSGDLDLSGCRKLTRYPGYVEVDGSVRLCGCTSLTSIADNLLVDGDLCLCGCSSLTNLPLNLETVGSLNLSACSSLQHLGRNIMVGGKLRIQNCKNLLDLPENLYVYGKLVVSGCVSLTSIPDGIEVSGLDITGCTGVTSLPSVMLVEMGERDLVVTGSGVSDQELRRFLASGGTGAVFDSLSDAVAFWVTEADASMPVPVPIIDPAYSRGVISFLSKLRFSKEFMSEGTKGGLALRVVEVINLLSDGDDGVRKEIQVHMAGAVDTCVDKPIWALSQMSVMVRTHSARGNRTALKALGMGLMRLGVVHQHVRSSMTAGADDVSTYLRFEIALREELNLPVSSISMAFPDCVTISDADIAAAKTQALALTDAQLEAWLPTWSEWQRQARVEYSKGVTYVRRRKMSEETFNLIGEPTHDPVQLHPVTATWSLNDLLRHWVPTGMDLNNTPRTIQYLRDNLIAIYQ